MTTFKKDNDMVSVSREDFERLVSIYQDVYYVKSKLIPLVSDDLKEKIENISNNLELVLKEEQDKDYLNFQNEYDEFDKIQKENNLLSIWSLSSVSSKEMNNFVSKNKIHSLEYDSWGPKQNVVFENPKKLTWLELWIEVDKLIRGSGDKHHIYFEQVVEDPKNSGHYKVLTGS